MSTVSRAVWDLQLDVVTAAAELLVPLGLDAMTEVTKVVDDTPPSLADRSVRHLVRRAPLADQITFISEAIRFREAFGALLETAHDQEK